MMSINLFWSKNIVTSDNVVNIISHIFEIIELYLRRHCSFLHHGRNYLATRVIVIRGLASLPGDSYIKTNGES